MNNFDWRYHNHQYTADFQAGRAIITEENFKSATIYNAEIKSLKEETIAQISGLDEFETVEAWISVNLIELDRVDGDNIFHQRQIETLELCLSLLTDTKRPFHHARIANLKRWVLGENQIPHQLPTKDWKSWAFDWENSQNRFETDTPHGNAVIIEEKPKQASRFKIGIASRYKVQIEDEAGSILKDTHESSLDFLDAEERLRMILLVLERPFITEIQLEVVSFTLAICRQLLLKDTDLMHTIRLNYLETYLWESLP